MRTTSWLGRCVCLLLLLAIAPGAARGQEPTEVRRIVLPSNDSQVAARIVSLDRRLNVVNAPHLAAGLIAHSAAPTGLMGAFAPILGDKRNQESWELLPDEYYRMMQESGEALASVRDAGPRFGVGWSSEQVRRLCQQRLAALPRSSLNLYRDRVDAEARALLEQGRRSRSPVPLRRLVDDLFCSRSGDQTLDLLGDLAFERGEFDQARHWWSLLAPPGLARADRLSFPDPKLDLVGIQAKQILALMFAGRLDEAGAEIVHFHQQHPDAKGHLAGQDDRYAVTLQKALANFARERIRSNDEPWTTFGGDATRNRVLSQGLSWQLWEDGPAWRVPLPALDSGEDARPSVLDGTPLSRRLAFHPVIVNNQVLLADHRSVVSYHLLTGKQLFRYDLKAAGLPDPGPDVDPKLALPRFTLTADHERAYVRLGGSTLTAKKRLLRTDASYLICLDLTEPGKDKKRELWRSVSGARLDGDDKAFTFFEGAPLVHGERVYIAQSKIAGPRVLTSIVCFDLLGRQRWAREVCDCPEFEADGNGARHRQHLLTWAGGQIAYASHTGAIVAVDAWTGQPTWGVRYPSRGPLTADLTPSPRDLAPCVYADGCVFAAPLDSDRIFCIDAVTGRIRWELDGVEVVYLLGSAHGRLYAGTRTGLVAVHTASGQIDWMQPSEGRLPSLGRGLIAGSWLLWPTQDATLPYRALSLLGGGQQKEGSTESVLPEPAGFEPTMLSTLPVGNLAFGQGCLAIAGKDELVVYAPAHKLDLPPINPRPPILLNAKYQEARRLESSGRTAEAARAYRQLLEITKSHPMHAEWRTLIETRLQRLANVGHDSNRVVAKKTPAVETDPKALAALRQRADESLHAKRWGDAADAYRRLAALTIPDHVRAQSMLGLARAYEGQRDYRSARKTWATLDERYGGLIEPAGRKPYRDLLPSPRREPYLSGLATLSADGPALPLVQAWSQVDGRVWRVDADDCQDFIFCTQSNAISCRAPADGQLRWKRQLDFQPGWLGRWRDLVIITDKNAARALRVSDGQTAWHVPAPSRAAKLTSVLAGVPTIRFGGDGFVHAERWDDTLLLLDDGRRFLRLRLDTGEIAWEYASPGAALRPLDAATFGPHVARIGSSLFAQDVSGQPVRLDAKRTPIGTRTRPWVQAPRVVGNRLVRADEHGRIVAQHPSPPHEVDWTYQAPWPTSLTGELCRLASKGNVLLASVPRNEGSDWIRLNVARGNLLWSTPARQLPDGLSIESVSIGDTSFYYADAQNLYARSLNDGALQWTQTLPTQSKAWRIGYTKDYLAVYPAQAANDDAFTVSFFDPWEGALLQRLTFPDAHGSGDVLLTPRLVLVSAGGRIFGFRGLDSE